MKLIHRKGIVWLSLATLISLLPISNSQLAATAQTTAEMPTKKVILKNPARLGVDVFGISDAKMFAPGENAEELAKALSKLTGTTSIVVLPQRDKYKENIKQAVANGLVSWSVFKRVLQQSGAVLVKFDSKTMGVIQGRSYRSFSNKICGRGDIWKDFQSGYVELSSVDKAALVSETGLVRASDFGDAPKFWHRIFDKLIHNRKPTESLSRVRVFIEPTIETAFLNASSPSVIGWWRWWDPFNNLKINFPEDAFLPVASSENIPAQEKLNLMGEITQDSFIRSNQENGKSKMRVSKDVQWPEIAVAGGKTSSKQILRCLEISTVAENRLLDGLMFLAPPKNAIAAFGSVSTTPEQQNLLEEILAMSATQRGIDLGPIPYAALQAPTKAYADLKTVSWLKPLLRFPPMGAYEQIGMSDNDFDASKGKDPELERAKAVDKWINLYRHTSIVSVPGIVLRAEIQEQRDWKGKKVWLPMRSQDVILLVTCRNG